MPAKTPKGEATRRRIVEAAADLFHQRGVRGTSPDDILRAAGVGKGQFYYYFRGKADLVHAVLSAHHDAIEGDCGPIPHALQTWDDLEAWFLAHVELQARSQMTRGCPFGGVGNELGDDDELLRLDVDRIFVAVERRLARLFLVEQLEGRLRADVEVDALARYCLAVVQGAMLLGKVRRDASHARQPIEAALAHLRSLRT